jgi:hypothetical protein
MKEHLEHPVIRAATVAQVTIAEARQWFLDLESNPERYQFETHAGFAFGKGNFGVRGARFQTWERFLGLVINLHFELTETSDSHFRFQLIRPPLPIWGAFVIKETANDTTDLSLEIGGTSTTGSRFLRLPVIRGAIRRQIAGEIEHIKTSMEAVRDSAQTIPF